jgi:UDP-N-acetylmuramate-alanine ligase
LQDYLKNNQKYLVNYGEREKANKVFTSQVAESHIDSIINTRHKRKKMQWTRQGAHNVLQIRAMMASNEWKENWLDVVLPEEDRAA